jgi:hypothetical protein
MINESDGYISLSRASELSGLSAETLRVHAIRGRLCTIRIGRDHLTTQRWLHEYLESRDDTRQQVMPLPADYQAPE